MSKKIRSILDWFTNPQSKPVSLNNFDSKRMPQCGRPEKAFAKICSRCSLHRPGIDTSGICPSCKRFLGEDSNTKPHKIISSEETQSQKNASPSELELNRLIERFHTQKTVKSAQKEKQVKVKESIKNQEANTSIPDLSTRKDAIIKAMHDGELCERRTISILDNVSRYGFSENEIDALKKYYFKFTSKYQTSPLIVYSSDDWWSRER